MPVDPGLAVLKTSRLICPFATTPNQYGMRTPPEIPLFCWFKAENMAAEGSRRLEPLVVECPYTSDFESCPIYQTNIPPL